MKVILSIFCSLVLAGLMFTGIAQAKSDEHWKAFEKAAEEYEQTSKHFAELAEKADKTEPEKASVYKKISDNYEDMADIKEKAARDAKRGKWGKVKWDKYEEMAKENEELKKLIQYQDPKQKADKKYHDKKKELSQKKYEKSDDPEKRIKELEHQLEIERKKLELQKLQEKKPN